MVPVNLFNANTLAVTVAINAAPSPVWIGGTNAGLGWRPQVLVNAVTMNPIGPAAPNVLSTGPNALAITPQGSTQPNQTQVNLPGAIQWISVQLYVFFEGADAANWIILNEGQYVTGGQFAG